MKKFQKLLLATAIASACQTAIAADAYDIIDLTAITQNDLSPALANDINNSGTVVGYLNGDYVDLLDDNGDPVTNDSGNVIQYLEFIKGFSTDGSGLTVFEAYEDSNQTTEVSSVNGINNAGISVGFSNQEYNFESTDSNGDPVSEIREQRRAVWFNESGIIFTIPELTPDAHLGMQAYSISDSGVIVGIAAYDRPNDVDENGDASTGTSKCFRDLFTIS